MVKPSIRSITIGNIVSNLINLPDVPVAMLSESVQVFAERWENKRYGLQMVITPFQPESVQEEEAPPTPQTPKTKKQKKKRRTPKAYELNFGQVRDTMKRLNLKKMDNDALKRLAAELGFNIFDRML